MRVVGRGVVFGGWTPRRREALALLRQGAAALAADRGRGAAAQALASLGHWDELREMALPKTSKRQQQQQQQQTKEKQQDIEKEEEEEEEDLLEEETVAALLQDPNISASGVVEAVSRVRPSSSSSSVSDVRSSLLEGAVSGRGGAARHAELLLAWARDSHVAAGPRLVQAAARAAAQELRWEDVLAAIGEGRREEKDAVGGEETTTKEGETIQKQTHRDYGHVIPTDLAASWVVAAARCGSSLLLARLMAALGPRGGRLHGAAAAAESDPRNALRHCEKEQGREAAAAAASQCIESMTQQTTTGEQNEEGGLAERLLLVADWAFQHGLSLQPRSVGKACLHLARSSNLEAIRRLLAHVQHPDSTCCAALVNCLAEMQLFPEALQAAERMHAEGVALTFASFRHLIDKTQDRPEQLHIFERAYDMLGGGGVGREGGMDTTAHNRWIKALLRFGKWQRALDLLSKTKPDIVTYVTLVSGLSDLDRPSEAVQVALSMMNDPQVEANEIAFCALRSLCRTHGLERQWPAMRAWCVSHGVRVGPVNSPWRETDKVAKDPARLKYPR